MDPLQFLFLASERTTYLPMFDLVAQTFIQMVPYLISFGVLVFFFAKFLYKPVKGILQKRADNIEADIKNASENRAEASALKAHYDEKLKSIEAERTEILEAARTEAAARVQQILGDAKEEAHIARERAKRDIAAEQARVKAEVTQAIIDISTDMAEKLVAASIDKTTQDRLFAEAMDELESTAFRSY